jgi:hypothetical protein
MANLLVRTKFHCFWAGGSVLIVRTANRKIYMYIVTHLLLPFSSEFEANRTPGEVLHVLVGLWFIYNANDYVFTR